jgi:transposase
MSKKEEKLTRKIKRLLRQLGFPRWLHHFGPKTYQLWQHIFAFVVMTICRLSLRRVEKFLSLVGVSAPTYSALCKSRKRIPLVLWQRVMSLTAGYPHQCVAIDGTGISRANPSFHYVKRIGRKKPVRSYVKQSSLFDIQRRTFVALRVRSKPRHDIKDVKYLMKRADVQTTLFGDTAYDAESLHQFCYERKIQTQIKPRKNVRKGFYRRKQMKKFSEKEYHQRSLIEAGYGGMKRKYGGYTLNKKIEAIRTEAYCKAICFNLRLQS